MPREFSPYDLAGRERDNPPTCRDRFDDCEAAPAILVGPGGYHGDCRIGVFDLDPKRCAWPTVPHPELATGRCVSHHIRDELVRSEQHIVDDGVTAVAEQLVEDSTGVRHGTFIWVDPVPNDWFSPHSTSGHAACVPTYPSVHSVGLTRRRTGHSCGVRIIEFDHRNMGTPEAYWSPLLADLPRIDPCAVPGPIVVVSPHPDDEVLAVGGTVQRLVLAGARVTVISLTDGEAADPDDPDLGVIRSAELLSAVNRLGLASIEVVRIGLGDGRLASVPPEDLSASIERHGGPAATWIAPLPDDGHPDHAAAGRATMAAAERTGARLWQYAVWAWHWGREDDLPLARAVRVDLDELVLARKRHAIDEFRSQTTGPDAILNAHVLSRFERPFEVFFT